MGLMDWKTAEQKFLMSQGRNMTWQERTRWDFQEWGQQMSIGGLWSYRGKIWKKYAGAYPLPEQVGLEVGHAFFDPDLVDHSKLIDRDGRVMKEEYRHHGRLLKPGDKRYPKNA